MFGLRKTLGSLLLVVAFLVLAAFATFFYNADQEQKNELVDNKLVKNSGETLGAIVGVTEKMTEVNVQKNIGMGKTMADFIGRVDWQGLLTGTSTKKIDSEENDEVNIETSDEIDKEMSTGTVNVENDVINPGVTGFWAKTAAKVKEEWRRGQIVESVPAETIDSTLGQGIFSYQKTNLGAEIIISSKSGTEYKLPLPFKFLSR